MIKLSRILAISVLTAFLLAFGLAGGASALSLINGGFETGDFTGWQTIGLTSIETAAFGSGPTEGNFDALLSTGDGAVSQSAVEVFLGLDGLGISLDTVIGGDAAEGSAIKQVFAANAGDVLKFDWNFLTDEDTPDANYNDFAFVTLLGAGVLADTFSPFVSSATMFNEETGFQTAEILLPYTGLYSLGFGVMDVGDETVDSGLLVDNAAPVPEPATMLLLGSGLLGLAGFGRKKFLKRK